MIAHKIRGDHPDRVLLLDVGVEGVVEEAVVRLVDPLHDRRGVGDGVEGVALEAVERLDGERDLRLGRILRRQLVNLDDVAPLVRRRRLAAEDAERLVEGPAEDFAARRLEAVDRPFEMGEAAGAGLRIGTGAVVLGVGDDADRVGAEPVIPQFAADAGVVLRRAAEKRQFDPVIAGRLDLAEHRKMLLGHLARPQHQIETQEHLHPLPQPKTSRAWRRAPRSVAPPLDDFLK